jgi:hypothetical protein
MSHQSDITAYLKKGGILTPLWSLKLFGCLSLSQRMSEIRLAVIGTKWRIVEDWLVIDKKRIKSFTMRRAK